VELKTNGLKMTVYLPDAEKGFYRGTRFDWSGVIGPVRSGTSVTVHPGAVPRMDIEAG
jgi:hypothetical protein